MDFPVLFEGDDDRGPIMAFPVDWTVEEEGVYWWDLYLNARAYYFYAVTGFLPAGDIAHCWGLKTAGGTRNDINELSGKIEGIEC